MDHVLLIPNLVPKLAGFMALDVEEAVEFAVLWLPTIVGDEVADNAEAMTKRVISYPRGLVAGAAPPRSCPRRAR